MSSEAGFGDFRKQTLVQLGARSLDEKPSDLNAAFKSLGELVPVSERYRGALSAFGGAAIVFDKGARFIPDQPSPLNDKQGYQCLEVLYGMGADKNSIEQKAAQYVGELPASFIPIGEASGGNLICVGGDGAVYLWDHESERDEGVWRVAASVDDFLRRLEADSTDLGGTEGIIESESFLDF